MLFGGKVLKSALALSIVMALAPLQGRAESSGLPIGPQAGDQNLSIFYRWTETLPARPGVMLREEQMLPQTEITGAGLAQRILYTSTDIRWHAFISRRESRRPEVGRWSHGRTARWACPIAALRPGPGTRRAMPLTSSAGSRTALQSWPQTIRAWADRDRIPI